MEIKEVKEAIEQAIEGLKNGTNGAKESAESALKKANDAMTELAKKADNEVVDALKSEFEAQKKSLQDEIDALGVKIKNSIKVEAQVKSAMEQIKEQFDANKDKLEEIARKSSGSFRMEIKAADDPISTSSFGNRVIFGFREAGVDKERLPERFVFDIISAMNGGVGSNPLSWVEMVDVAGGPDWTAENAEKPAMNWKYAEQKVTAEMLAVYTVVTRQALLNWAILEQEIRVELTRMLYNELDYAIINGDGTNNSIYGIKHYATAFNPGTVRKSGANELDVLRVAISQVRKGAGSASYKKGGFTPTAILVSEDTAAKMDIAVNDEGSYLLPPFTSDGNTRVKGVRVITSNFIEDDEFIVGDFSRYLFNVVDGLKIDVGYINEQFIHNQITLRAELYGMGRVKNHEKPAFVKGTFDAAIAALESTT